MRISLVFFVLALSCLVPLRAATAGYALIVQGGYRDDDAWRDRYAETARRVRQCLVQIGVTSTGLAATNDLWVLSSTNSLATPDSANLMDGSPTIANIRSVLEKRIGPAIDENPAPFYLVFVGPATPGVLHLHGSPEARDDLRANQLRTIMDEFQSKLGISGRAAYKVLVVGSPFAASIAPDLSLENNNSRFARWVSIAASGAAEPAYAGPSIRGIETINEGCFFTAELFRSLARTDYLATLQSPDLLKAFSRAASATFAMSRGWRRDNDDGEERNRPQQHPVITAGAYAGADPAQGDGGLFSFPDFDNSDGNKFQPLIANLQFHDFIRGTPSFAGDDATNEFPKLRARIPVDLDNYYGSSFRADSFVVAFARPWDRPQQPLAEWTRYHLEPDIYGFVMSSEANGPDLLYEVDNNPYGFDYALAGYEDLKDGEDYDFKANGFKRPGMWQIMARVYRHIGSADNGYDHMNPNAYEVASTLATGCVFMGNQHNDIGNYAAFSSEGNEGGHNPIIGTNQVLDIGRPIRFGFDSHANWFDVNKDQHEVWYSIAVWAPGKAGDPDFRLYTKCFDRGIPGGFFDRDVLRQAKLAGLGGVTFQVRALGNNATWDWPANDGGNGFSFALSDLQNDAEHNENPSNDPSVRSK